MMSGLGGMVAQGMAFGTGSAIAHQVRLAMAVAWGGGKVASGRLYSVAERRG